MRETLEVGGRRIEIERSGPDGADAVVFFHTGTPSAGIMFEPMVAAGASRGMRHIAYSRPGYAHSDRRPGRTVADCAADVAAIADQLEIDRFYTVGWSGGGPHALAMAAWLPQRVAAVATIAGIAPYTADDLDFTQDMGESSIEEFEATIQGGEAELRSRLEAGAPARRSGKVQDLVEAWSTLLCDVDRATMAQEFGEDLAACVAHALHSGVDGWLDDNRPCHTLVWYMYGH